MLRVPWTLYRAIAADLVRVIGLTTAVLVTVITFGAAVKPLASDALLDALQTLRYLGLATVPMLQFALPFAAGFGSTIALHRMTADNEVLAMAVGGMSYWRMLVPVAALALVLGIIMVLLTQWVVPRFWFVIEQMLATDVATVLQASVRRGEAFKMDDLRIYADDIIVREQPEGPDGPERRLFLIRVAAAELDPQGRIVTEVTASQALVDVYRREGRTYLKLVLSDAVSYSASAGDLAYSPKIIPRALMIQGANAGGTKTMTQTQLLELARHPDGFSAVITERESLAQAIRESQSRSVIDVKLASEGRLELEGEPVGDSGERRRLVILAAGLSGGQLRPPGAGRIEVEELDAARQPIRRFVADSARLEPAADAVLGSAAYDLTLGPHDVTDLRRAGATNRRSDLTFHNLGVAGAPEDDLSGLASAALLQRAAAMPDGSDRVRNRIEKLQRELRRLQWEVSGKVQARYALSMIAVLLPLAGACLAMLLRGSLPLAIYLWAFAPSILSVILISAGTQLLRDGRMAGQYMLWSGDAAILALLLGSYARLARN